MKDLLIDRLRAKRAVIGIIGLGYVGLPLVLRYSQVGYKVIGFDIDAAKARKLAAGQSYIEHISAEDIARAKLIVDARGRYLQPLDKVVRA